MANLVNNTEDSDKESDKEDNSPVVPANRDDEVDEVCFSGTEQLNELNNAALEKGKNPTVINETFYDTEFSQIEELKVELEKCLGLDLFLNVYKFVEKTVDPKEVKFDYETIKNSIQNELKGKYKPSEINKAIDKINEIFTIIAQERLSNLRQ
ncbi:MAG: hypothetical protein MJ252_04295 [archaeon]|nr:hypothetical protein [archaeon]